MKPTTTTTTTRPQRTRTVAGLILVSAASVCLLVLLIAQTTEATKEQQHIKQTIKSQVPKQLTKESHQKVAPIERRASNSNAADQAQTDSAKQVAADKKQGDQIDALFNTDEYVQIKPEEITVNEQGKDTDPVALALADLPSAPAVAASAAAAAAVASQSSSQSAGSGSGSSPVLQVAQHKSADDELNAHLAQDTISALESANRQYAAPAPQMADQRAARPQYQQARGGYMPPPRNGPASYPPPPPPSPYQGPRAASGSRPYGPPPAPKGGEYRGPRSPHYPAPGPYGGGPRGMAPAQSQPQGYKAKSAGGMSSMVPYPRPYGGAAPMHPSSGSYGASPSRYFPRGAAAGYAAFRDFVRSQASRYKQQGGAPEPVLYNAAPPSGPSYGASAGQSHMPPPPPPPAPTPSYSKGSGYNQPPPPPPPTSPAAPASYEAPQQVKIAPSLDSYAAPRPATESAYGGQAAPASGSKTKVTVAQAYIPHLSSQQASGAYGGQAAAAGESSASSGGQSYATNPVLAKLYGNHAPQGAGRPEYSKDYGMVIHYPQATVYTEPMTVDQLHKLAGSSIGQILEHLQHNLASGQRDESNTLRPNNKHHLGHGLSIHAKEYYAPGKGGQYVPTTAAVISSSSSAGPASKGAAAGGSYESAEMAAAALAETGYGSQPGSVGGSYSGEQAAMSSHPTAEAATYGLKPELGSGYERVKAAVAASSTRYSGPTRQVEYASAGQNYAPQQQAGGSYQSEQPQPQQQQYQPQQQQQQQQSGKYEPLGAIASIIGGELEMLYNKANSVLAKQLDPEIHAHVQAHLKSLTKLSPLLKVTEHDHKSPLALRSLKGYEAPRGPPAAPPAHRPYGPQPMMAQTGGYPRPPPPPQAKHYMRGRAPRRPNYPPAPQYARQPNANRHPAGPYGRQPGSQPQGYNQQQQQAQSAYNLAEHQAVQQQMAQLLHEFQLGDEQYSPRGQSAQTANQGYPNKLMNSKYQQQQQQQQQQYPQQQQQQQQQQYQSQPSYEQGGALEIPQGPNDQIGEISELIEALKGTLEAHKPDGDSYQQQTPASPGQPIKDSGKLEDVRYLASALGQVPTYAIQVPVSQPQQQPQQQQSYQSGEGAVNEALKKGYQQEAAAYRPQQPYGQQQQQQQQQQPQAQVNYGGLAQSEQAAYQSHEASAAAGYGALQQQVAPAAGSYGQAAAPMTQGYAQQGPSQQAYAGQPQEAQAYGPAQAGAPAEAQAGYGSAGQQVDAYGPQQQPDLSSGYANAAAAAPQAAAPATGHAAQPQQAYSSQQQQQQQPQQQQQQQSYSSSEHTQLINHLVPVQQSQSADYSGSQSQPQQQHPQQQQQQQQLEALTSGVSHPPMNQISVAAPSDSQYQSAQSLSSFVDSLPNDYQELLRQPAGHASLLDSSASSVQESVYSNASAATTATASSNNNALSSAAASTVAAAAADTGKIPPSPSQASSPLAAAAPSHHHQNQEPLLASASSSRYQQQSPSRTKITSTSAAASSPAMQSSSGQQHQQQQEDKITQKK